MNIALWTTQGLLAGVFGVSGMMKATLSKDALVTRGQTGVQKYNLRFIRFIAWAELMGAVGLVVPWWVGVARALTPLAALGLATIMVGAAFSHGQLARESPMRRRRELFNVLNNLVLLLGCAFVAVARFAPLLHQR